MTSSPSKTGFLTLNDAPLYYEIAGEGEPLVLLHAGVADSRMWDGQFAAFTQQYRVLRYDLRGFGQSAVPAQHFAQHEELADIFRQLHIARAHVVGLSYGSKVALDFALLHPELVKRLVLVAPSVSGSEPTADVLAFYEAEENALDADDLEGATELNLKMWVDGPRRSPDRVDPAVRSLVATMQLQAFQTVFPEAGVELDLEPPAIQRLREVQAPTLIIVGDYDVTSKVELAQHLQQQIPDAQLSVVEGVAHMVNLEKPAEFNQLVLAFLGQV
jgi:pimeloyl-ACP methyl ester carboxylesterase